MSSRIRLILATAAIGVAGCAAAPTTQPVPAVIVASSSAAHLPDVIARAKVSLDDIEPRAVLPPGKGSSVGHPPLEAVHLYAQAQLAFLDRDRASAIDWLEKAVALDPLSYELHVALGRLYLTPTTEFSDHSIEMLEKAADLEPDHLDLQSNLGRQYLAKGDATSALRHFRLALRTRQYPNDGPTATITEFFLATLLRKEGYDQAALDVYQRLSQHLKSTGMAMRTSLEVVALREHRDAIDGDIADLLVRTGRYDDAIVAFAGQVELHPSDFDLRSRQVHLLMVSHHRDQALAAAEDAAVHFRASSESIALLNEACLAAGHTDGAAGALTRLHEAHPGDHAILFALADVLRGDKRDADAEKVLASAAARDPGDFEILRRRVTLKIDARQRDAAARMLIEATAVRPDLDAESAPLWSRLARAGGTGRLRYTDLIALDVPHHWEASKWFWVWRLANAAHRDDIARDALEKSVKATPAFPPAYRDKADEIWGRDDLGDEAKMAATEALAAQAEAAFDKSLAAEMHGIALLRGEKFADAAAEFSRAMDLGGKSPDLILSRASALRKSSEESAADALLWKVISDHPALRDAYEDLYLASIRRDMDPQAERVIATWIAADPQSVTARRIQAIQAQRTGRTNAAETILVRLFNEHPDDPEAVDALSGYYLRRSAVEKLLPLLEQRHALEPGNMAVSTALVDALESAHRQGDAARVLDAARGAALDDPDLLYSLSTLYARIGKKDASEEVLAEVLKLEPGHPGAANDLGYVWAEGGKNLEQAETLIRQAVDAEPANVSYLDSMGWVLYKRGKWAEARGFLDRAIGNHDAPGSARPADPVVLNHRGDVLYRLGEKDAAAADWRHASDRIGAMKDDADDEMKTLQLQLLEKTRKEKAGEEVKVSPVEKAESDQKLEIRNPKLETNSKEESGKIQN